MSVRTSVGPHDGKPVFGTSAGIRDDGKHISAYTGSGLGLAIADAIATGAGITLQLRSPASGRHDGFEAELTVHPTAAGV